MVTPYEGTELHGKSTDPKPTNVKNGSVYWEMDTGKVFVFDKETDTWLEV